MPTPAPMAPPINAPFSSESRSCADAWPGDTTSDAISAAANVTCFMCLIMLINRRYASSGPLNEHCRHKTRRTESAPARLFQSRQRDGLRWFAFGAFYRLRWTRRHDGRGTEYKRSRDCTALAVRIETDGNRGRTLRGSEEAAAHRRGVYRRRPRGAARGG